MLYEDHRLVERVAPSPLSYKETWTYDAQGRVKSHKDRLGKNTSYSYDAAGNLTRVWLPTGQGNDFTYDPATGLVASVKDYYSGQTTRFEYDVEGNMTAVISHLGSKTTLEYDSAGRPIAQVEPEHFSEPHPGAKSEHDRYLNVRVSDRVDQTRRFLRAQRRNIAPAAAGWAPDRLHDVATEELPQHRLAERREQHAMNVEHCLGRQALFEGTRVQPLDMERLELGKFQPPLYLS